MFDWTFDEETNGLLLTEGRALTRNSEVMPVYATELRLFGLHEKIGIPEETGTPIAWYKRGTYYYEGRKFARRTAQGALDLQHQQSESSTKIDTREPPRMHDYQYLTETQEQAQNRPRIDANAITAHWR